MDWNKNRVGACERGENPMAMVKMKSGYAVIGDKQFLPGYCVLLASPIAYSLNILSLDERKQFLVDMSLIGDAIMQSTDAIRPNYSIHITSFA